MPIYVYNIHLNNCNLHVFQTWKRLYALGWRDLEKNATLSMLCQIVVGPQFKNVMSECCLFTFHRASRRFWLLRCYPKMSKHFCFLFYIFKGYTCKKKCALACLKAKTEERERKKYVSHVQIKNHFAHFGRKIIKQIWILNLIFSLMYREGFCK